MKDKEKQIEEMKDIVHNLWDKLNQDAITTNDIIDALYNAGYRKIDKDSVVLSTEELKDMVKARTKCVENAIIRTRKETAEKILKIIKEEYGYIGNLEKIIAKQFGVEIKEGEQ